MTSANVFNWTAVNSNQTLNANAATSRSKADNPEVASVFASMMMPNYSTASNAEVSSTASAKSDKSVNPSGSAGAYDRYQYRDNAIDRAQNSDIRDKIAGAAEELAGFEEKVTETIAGELGISEEQVVLAMENLGLTAFDLMEPQNLVQLTMTLTGEADLTGLLTNPAFVNLMQDVSAMGVELMDILGLPMEQMDELIAQMDVLEEPEVLPDTEFAEAVGEALSSGTEVQEPILTQTAAATESAGPEIIVQDNNSGSKETVASDTVEPDTAGSTVAETEEVSAEDNDMDGAKQESDSAGTKQQTRTVTQNEQPTIGAQHVDGLAAQNVPQTPEVDASYLSDHTIDIIEQIAEQVKVGIAEGTASMEMQLNPENLGKLYLQISAKEGAVNAQIAAANEAVKQALETQIATLRENLDQAGVKVDAIEVTVASHEFERNLEQDQHQAQQEGESTQQQSHRRNLNLSSLDELSGVMTEEEALVAQIMKDNGNSVDLTA